MDEFDNLDRWDVLKGEDLEDLEGGVEEATSSGDPRPRIVEVDNLDRWDVLKVEDLEDLEDGVEEATGSGDPRARPAAQVEEWGNLEVPFPDRLIKDKSNGLGFPGFFACDWSSGQMYPFSEGSANPTQVFVGSDLMRATYRFSATYEYLGEERMTTGSAVALSPHNLVTAAHNIKLTLVHPTTKCPVRWNLKNARVMCGEFVLSTKIQRIGYACKILEANTLCRWESQTVCPQDGSDFLFLEVEEELPCFALPCSPQLHMRVLAYGYPGALSFLLRARKELVHKDPSATEFSIWKDYLRLIWDDLKDFIMKHGGDLAKAEEEAKNWLFSQFKKALSGIPAGAQTVSSGSIEAITPSFIGHTCPTLSGLSGGAIAPAEVPGHICAVHDGSLETNENVATSSDNPLFVQQYMKYVLCNLPGPDWTYYSRPYFSIAPFLSWLHRHAADLPPTSVWAKFLRQQQEQQQKLKQQQMQIQENLEPSSKKRKFC